MILGLNLSIQGWFPEQYSEVKSWDGVTPIQHKHWTFTLLRTSDLVEVSAKYTWRRDHAGLTVALSLLSWSLELEIYDHRHWDHNTGQWQV